MTALTTYPIRELEPLSPELLRNRVCMAIQADLGGVRCLQPQIAGDALGLIIQKHLVCLRVFILTMPYHEFILHDHCVLERLGSAMTGTACTGYYTQVRIGTVLWQGRCDRFRP